MKNNETKTNEHQDSQPLTEGQRTAFSKYFVDSDEKLVSSLGNRYIENFIADGTLKNGFSVISNKRVYFRGSCFVGSGKNLVKSDEERVVDLGDVTGSGFIYRRHLGILLSLFGSLIVVLAAVIYLLAGWSGATSTMYQDQLRVEEQKLAEYKTYAEEKENHPGIIDELMLEKQELEGQNRLIAEYTELSDGGWSADTAGRLALSNYFNGWNPLNEFIAISGEAEGETDLGPSTVEDLDELLLSVQTLQKIGKAYQQQNQLGADEYLPYEAFYQRWDELGVSMTDEELETFYNMIGWVESVCEQAGTSDYPYDYISFLGTISGDASRIDPDYTYTGDLCDPAIFVITSWRDAVQSILDYRDNNQSALTSEEQARLDELDEQIAVYENVDEALGAQEETVAALQRVAQEEKQDGLVHIVMTCIAGGAAAGLIVLVANYLRKRKTYFEINYAGGKIAFDVSLYPKAEIQDFQKQLRRAKDYISEARAQRPSAPAAAAPAPAPSKADELEKYAALLEKGVLTQEEFETLKRKALEK